MDYATAQQQQTNLDLLVAFEAEMDSREQAGVVIALPESEARFKTMQRSEDLRNLIWQRLYSLGYAPQAKLAPTLGAARRVSSTSRFIRREVIETVEQKYAKAVKRFQADAGTTQDGWVGLQTWESLQQLFNFEHDANLQKWLEPERRAQFQSVFYRAVHLRLILLGIADKPAKGIRASGNITQVQQLLQHWQQWLIKVTAKLSTMPDPPLSQVQPLEVITEDSPDIAIIEFLFDIDRLSQLVSAHLHLPEPIETAHFNKSRLDRLSKCLLKVELWLYGFEGIQPGSRGLMTPIKYAPLRKKRRKGNALSNAVSEFLDESGETIDTDDYNNESLLIRLAFRHVNLLDDSQEPNTQSNAETRSQMLVERINALKEDHTEQFEQDVKKSSGFGAWFFDGIRRLFRKIKKIWGSIKDFFFGLSEKVKSFIKALADATKKLVSDTFSAVKRTFQILTDGFQFIAQSEIVDREHYQVGFHKDRDMDLIVFVAEGANPKNIDKFWRHIDTLMLRTKAAMVIAGVIIKVIFNVLSNAFSGMMGFIRILLALHKMLDSSGMQLVKQAYASYQ